MTRVPVTRLPVKPGAAQARYAAGSPRNDTGPRAAATRANCLDFNRHVLFPVAGEASPGAGQARVRRRVVTTWTSAPRVPVSIADLGK